MDISVEEAKKLDKIEKYLINEFKQQIKIDARNEEIKQKTFEPITSAISRVEGKIGEVLDENKNLMGLVPVVNEFANVSIPESSIDLPASTPFRPIREKYVPEESAVVSPKTLNQILGKIAQDYLPRAHDNKFGLHWDKHVKLYKIGDAITGIDDNDLIVDGIRYKGTHGLWRLLTYKDKPDDDFYSEEDLENYTKILWQTNAIYKNNDPSTNKPKSSRGDKYKNLIRPIWNSKNTIEGSGVKKYNENKIEYKIIDNLNDLDRTINFILSEELAGNNNYLNEKKAIKDYICNRLDQLIENPGGAKYLKRILPLIPISGSGIVNDIINNLPFELHVPTYQYLGPGTKLEKRLKEEIKE